MNDSFNVKESMKISTGVNNESHNGRVPKEFVDLCLEALNQRKLLGVKRLLLKGHPALEIGDFLICLNTNDKRLLVSTKATKDRFLERLTVAPGHRWVYSEPLTFFGYFAFVVSNGCNLRCQYCFAGTALPQYNVSPELARKMAKQIPNFSPPDQYPRVYFFGGEPTLNLSAIDSIMDELDKMNVDYIPKLLTNGIFSNQTLDFIAERHMIVQFSHDGPANSLRMTPRQHDKLLNNIHDCAQLGLPIIIRPTVSSLNVNNLTDILDEMYSIAGEQLMSINFGMLNLNKGDAQGLSSDLLPDQVVFTRRFEEMLERARELGVRISSPHMTYLLRTTPESHFYQPCFISTEGLLSIAASYGKNHPEARNLIFGYFDDESERFVVDIEVLQRMEVNYYKNRFLCDEQNCYAQSLCGGLKKAVKFSREVYEADHIEFFKHDIECASMRAMTEVYIIDFLKVLAKHSLMELDITYSNDIWDTDIQPLTLSAY